MTHTHTQDRTSPEEDGHQHIYITKQVDIQRKKNNTPQSSTKLKTLLKSNHHKSGKIHPVRKFINSPPSSRCVTVDNNNKNLSKSIQEK